MYRISTYFLLLFFTATMLSCSNDDANLSEEIIGEWRAVSINKTCDNASLNLDAQYSADMLDPDPAYATMNFGSDNSYTTVVISNRVSPVDDLTRNFMESGSYSIEDGILMTKSSGNIVNDRTLEISGNDMTLEELEEPIGCLTILKLVRK